jgi:hypothetical protein
MLHSQQSKLVLDGCHPKLLILLADKLLTTAARNRIGASDVRRKQLPVTFYAEDRMTPWFAAGLVVLVSIAGIVAGWFLAGIVS